MTKNSVLYYCEMCEVPAHPLTGVVIADPFSRAGTISAVYLCPECKMSFSRIVNIVIDFEVIPTRKEV